MNATIRGPTGEMMRRLVLLLCLLPALVRAESLSLEAQIAAALDAQGFGVTVMERTWLGRLRVIAQSDSHQRELVFDPATGEILQDYLVSLAALARRTVPPQDDDDAPPQDWSTVVHEAQSLADVAIPDVAIAGD